MSRTRHAGHTTGHPLPHGPHRVLPPRTPGHLGINDQADPSVRAAGGDTPGPSGVGDHPPPGLHFTWRPQPEEYPIRLTGLPPAGTGQPVSWVQLGSALDRPEGDVFHDPALSAALGPRNLNGRAGEAVPVEHLSEQQVQRAEAELQAAAQRMAEFSARRARDPDRYEPVHSAEPGYPIIGYWFVWGGHAGVDYVAADHRRLLDVQGREVTRVAEGLEPAVIQADDFIPFNLVAGLGRRAVTTGGRLASRAITALARRAIRRTVVDRLRQAAAQAVGRTAARATTGALEHAGARIGERLRQIGQRLDEIVANSRTWRPGTSGLTPEEQIGRVENAVEANLADMRRLRRLPAADGVTSSSIEGATPQQLETLAEELNQQATVLIARARARLPQVVQGPAGQVGVIEAGGTRTVIRPIR